MRFIDVVDRIEKEYAKYASDDQKFVVLQDSYGYIIIHRTEYVDGIGYQIDLYENFNKHSEGKGYDIRIEQLDTGDFMMEDAESQYQHCFETDGPFDITDLDANTDHGDWENVLEQFNINPMILRIVNPAKPLMYKECKDLNELKIWDAADIFEY